MAIQTTLRLVFLASNDKKLTFTYPNADSSASASQVKTLMQVIIANGDIFAEEPLSIVGAEFVARDVTEINVS